MLVTEFLYCVHKKNKIVIVQEPTAEKPKVEKPKVQEKISYIFWKSSNRVI